MGGCVAVAKLWAERRVCHEVTNIRAASVGDHRAGNGSAGPGPRIAAEISGQHRTIAIRFRGSEPNYDRSRQPRFVNRNRSCSVRTRRRSRATASFGRFLAHAWFGRAPRGGWRPDGDAGVTAIALPGSAAGSAARFNPDATTPTDVTSSQSCDNLRCGGKLPKSAPGGGRDACLRMKATKCVVKSRSLSRQRAIWRAARVCGHCCAPRARRSGAPCASPSSPNKARRGGGSQTRPTARQQPQRPAPRTSQPRRIG
jgi:hypothetical protein